MLNYIEVSSKSLIHNINQFRSIINPDTKIAAVIKANAYGHDQNVVAKTIENHIDYYQVDSIEELEKLREVTEKPALVLGYVAFNDLDKLIELNGTPTVYDLKRVEELNRICRHKSIKQKVHIKIDAQLGRQGLLPKSCGKFAVNLEQTENIEVEGIYMHFANIEDTNDPVHANKQQKNWQKKLKQLITK